MRDLSLMEVLIAVGGVLGLAKILELVVSRLLNHRTTEAFDAKVKAETVSMEVSTVREVLKQVQEHSATKDAVIEDLRDQMRGLAGRVERVEAREHQLHALTAAHEIWDLKTYQMMLSHYPEWAEPPPLRAPLLVEAHITTEPRQIFEEKL